MAPALIVSRVVCSKLSLAAHSAREPTSALHARALVLSAATRLMSHRPHALDCHWFIIAGLLRDDCERRLVAIAIGTLECDDPIGCEASLGGAFMTLARSPPLVINYWPCWCASTVTRALGRSLARLAQVQISADCRQPKATSCAI